MARCFSVCFLCTLLACPIGQPSSSFVPLASLHVHPTAAAAATVLTIVRDQTKEVVEELSNQRATSWVDSMLAPCGARAKLLPLIKYNSLYSFLFVKNRCIIFGPDLQS
ncbi:hypothetical protein EJB05_42928, partial [Eragrostis curvula]